MELNIHSNVSPYLETCPLVSHRLNLASTSLAQDTGRREDGFLKKSVLANCFANWHLESTTFIYGQLKTQFSPFLLQKFHEAAYMADERQDLLTAINCFLDSSVVLPPSEMEGDDMLRSVSHFQRDMLRKRDQQDGGAATKEPDGFKDVGEKRPSRPRIQGSSSQGQIIRGDLDLNLPTYRAPPSPKKWRWSISVTSRGFVFLD